MLIVLSIIVIIIIALGMEFILSDLKEIKMNQEKSVQENKLLKDMVIAIDDLRTNQENLAFDVSKSKEEIAATVKDEANRTIHTIAVTPLKVTRM